MKRKFNEAISYGDRPERMDPKLEKKLGDPEGLYAKNPAMRKGPSDVERLVSSRFQKVAKKLSEVSGVPNLSTAQVQAIYMQAMSALPKIMRIERQYKDELESLAVDAVLDDMQISPEIYQIEANLGQPNISGFRTEPQQTRSQQPKPQETELPSFEVEDLTNKEKEELDKHKRNIINAIIQGSAKKGHYLFEKPEVRRKLDEIDGDLYSYYMIIMAVNDMLYFTMEDMIEMASRTGQGIGGKVELDDVDPEYQEENENVDTKIIATGLIFPILCHEIIKGIEEAKARVGLPKDAETRSRVLSQTDTLSNEPMQLRIGPEIVEKIRFGLPNEMFDEKNRGLINFFHIVLYQLEAIEFLEIIGNIISENESRIQKGKDRFRELMQEAQELKSQFEEYKQEEGIDSDEDNLDDINDFLTSMGIDPIVMN